MSNNKIIKSKDNSDTPKAKNPNGDKLGVLDEFVKSGETQKADEQIVVKSISKEEVEWGSRKVSKASLKWLTYGVIATTAAIVSSLLIANIAQKKDTAVNGDVQEVENISPVNDAGPKKWFVDRSGDVCEEASNILEAFLSSDDTAVRSSMVTDEAFYLENSVFDLKLTKLSNKIISLTQWDVIQSGQIAFLRLNTFDDNSALKSVYFCRVGDEIKIDWAATIAWSEFDFSAESLAELDSEPKILRCVITRKKEFYMGLYNDKDYASYQLINTDKKENVWAYVERDSKLDETLKKLIVYQSYVRKQKKNVRVTVKIAKTKSSPLNKQVDLVELLHTEWVTP